MSTDKESTANSMKFTPLPMSELLKLMPPKKPDTPVTSDHSGDESDNSNSESTTKRKILPTTTTSAKKPEPITFTPKVNNPTSRVIFSERKPHLNESNKENCNENSAPNRTYPNHDSNFLESNLKSASKASIPNEVIKVKENPVRPLNILTPRNTVIAKPQESSQKNRTPDILKVPSSSHKTKTPTPKIKSGIRRFTPGSNNKKSNKKTPQKILIQHDNKERVRCLFPDNPPKAEPLCPPPAAQTPMNRKPLPMSTATPSYPQGMVKNQSKIMFKTTLIKGKSYMFVKKLGIGGSSEVYKVLEVGTSCEYAVKCVNLGTDPEMARGYVNEVRLLRELQNSDRVIRLYDYEYDRENKFLRVVLEVGETDLSSFLRARGSGLPPALVLYYWEEMLHAVRHIHDHGVIHADLKPANFLLVCGRLKLIDFGIASAVASDATSVVRAQAAGTYSYISPEALMGGAGGYTARGEEQPIKISFRSDVWSLGCILYSMVYGKTPFAHIPNLAKLAAILDPNHRIDYPPTEHLPPSLIASLQWCLTYNARSRPSVRELLAIPYLQPTHKPLPTSLLEKLQALVTPDEFKLLQRAQL